MPLLTLRAANDQYYAQQGVESSTGTGASAGPSDSSTSSAYENYGYAPGAPATQPDASAYVPIPYDPTQYETTGFTPIGVPHRQLTDTDLINQSNAYLPGAAVEMARKGKHRPPGKRDTVVRKGNGRVWEDPTLIEWDPSALKLPPLPGS